LYACDAEVKGLSYRTTLLSEPWELGQAIAVYGWLWVLPVIGFVLAAVALFDGWAWWNPFGLGNSYLAPAYDAQLEQCIPRNRCGGCDADPHFSGFANPPIVFSPLDILIVLLTVKMPPNGRISPQEDWLRYTRRVQNSVPMLKDAVPVELYACERATHISTDSTYRATMASTLN